MLSSINQLSELTGFDRRTIKARLGDMVPIVEGRAHLYQTREALPLLYLGTPDETVYDLTEERARLAHHQANCQALTERQLTGELLPAAQVAQMLTDAVLGARAKLLRLPGQLAAQAMAATTLREVEDATRETIYAALEELAAASDDLAANIPTELDPVATAAASNGG